MRPAKLYLEIFISFVLVMIVSETMIFFLFTDSERRIFGYTMEQNTIMKVRMLKELVDEKIRWMKGIPPGENQELYALLASSEIIYDAQIWIADDGGTPVVIPSGYAVPEDIGLLDDSAHADFLNEIQIHNNIARTRQVYASVSLKSPKLENLKLYIVFNTRIPPHHRWRFVIGLSIIGIVVAFLIIPVSKFITDRLKVLKASALRIAEGELSHRVSVKTKDEIGELGIAFNQMAERLERMILGGKELTANVSHELRTPLTRIRIAQEILQERLEKGDFTKCERHMDEIREDIEELDILIGRILELSKLDVHEVPFKLVPFDLAPLLDELLERLGPVVKHKNLTIHKHLLYEPPIKGDGISLHMAFLNILENAVKFCPEGGIIRVTMSLNKAAFATSITNSYEELSKRDLEMIFEPFYRSKKSNTSGTGLGLSISSKIIQRHHGRIKANNTPDGLQIRVELPI